MQPTGCIVAPPCQPPIRRRLGQQQHRRKQAGHHPGSAALFAPLLLFQLGCCYAVAAGAGHHPAGGGGPDGPAPQRAAGACQGGTCCGRGVAMVGQLGAAAGCRVTPEAWAAVWQQPLSMGLLALAVSRSGLLPPLLLHISPPASAAASALPPTDPVHQHAAHQGGGAFHWHTPCGR